MSTSTSHMWLVVSVLDTAGLEQWSELGRISNQTRKIQNSNFKFKVKFGLKIQIRLKSMVEFGSKLIKQDKFGQIDQKQVQKGVKSNQIWSNFTKFEVEFSPIWSLRSNSIKSEIWDL